MKVLIIVFLMPTYFLFGITMLINVYYEQREDGVSFLEKMKESENKNYLINTLRAVVEGGKKEVTFINVIFWAWMTCAIFF